MLRMITALSILATSLVFASSASAAPDFMDVVAIDHYFGMGDTLTYTHDITRDGFDPLVDTAESFALTIQLRDDRSGGPVNQLVDFFIPEIAFVDLPGSSADAYFLASMTDAVLGVSVDALLALNTTGRVDITIASVFGDFVAANSVLSVRAAPVVSPSIPPGSSPVPEPTAAAVFGLGSLLVGRRVARRR